MVAGRFKQACRTIAPLFLALLALLVTSAAALAVTGQLTQLPGTAGCVSEHGTAGACADGKALAGASSVAVSPDGKNVYVASGLERAVAVFRRNTATGALTQLAGTAGCISQTGSDGACADGKGLGGARSVAVSPDGKNVYVASESSSIVGAVAVLTRDTTTGALTQPASAAGCISELGGDAGDACLKAKALREPHSIAVSPDGKNVYVASKSSESYLGSVAAFWRNSTTGALAQLAGTAGCVSDDGSSGACVDGRALGIPWSLVVSADGMSVYVASPGSDAVAVLTRNGTNGALTQRAGAAGCISETGTDPRQPGAICADGKALDSPWGVAASPDGKSVYVASHYGGFPRKDAVAVLRRNTTNGALTQLAGTAGCVSPTGLDGNCATGKALLLPWSLAVSEEGKSVYVTSLHNHGMAVFSRDTTTGAITQLRGTRGCVTDRGSNGNCFDGEALRTPVSVSVSADGKSVYVASIESDAVAVFARETSP